MYILSLQLGNFFGDLLLAEHSRIPSIVLTSLGQPPVNHKDELEERVQKP